MNKSVIAILIVVAAVFFYTRQSADSLVVYCAHDSVYADPVLQKFAEETGINLKVRYDTEAIKSLGLIELLIKEKENPRCDVFWNNEILGIMDLKERGLLAPYKGSGWKRIPEQFKDADGYWAGFGARLRVYIINKDKFKSDPEVIKSYFASGNLSKAAIAKPLYGTTLTHYSVLWDFWGEEKLKKWHAQTRKNKLKELASNGQTCQAVSEGICQIGFTDTDDYFSALDRGKPVDMLPVRLSDNATIAIPNTAAIIKNCKNPKAAKRLVDYLLSAKSEIMLANSRSRQIPLGEIAENKIPQDVKKLKTWAADGYSLSKILQARNDCLKWLKTEYVR